MPGELIVSVSGIRDRVLPDLDNLADLLDGRGVPLSLFVAPRRKKGYRIEDDPAAVDWVTRRRDRGDALVLNGFDVAATKRLRHEFAALSAHEANLRLLAADRALERVGLRTRLFAAPGWATSAGTEKVLPRNGFRLLIRRTGTTDLVRGTEQRGRVLGIGAGFVSEPWWCRALVLAAERNARRGGPVRIAVGANHLAKPPVLQAVIDAVDLSLMHGCSPGVYRWRRGPAITTAA